jgi:RES domain-containing protein
MKETSLVSIPFFRMHSPRWAYMPTSGSGAAKQGGRANRKDLPALYLAADTTTAIGEYQQTASILPPGLMVSYEVSLARVVDFSAGFDKGWDALWQEFYCDWRALRFDQGIEPPSWTLGDWVLNAGCAGLLFPSQANPGGINLVIYTEALGADDSINVYDPNGDLPTSQASWR